jgi:hypothetical protein
VFTLFCRNIIAKFLLCAFSASMSAKPQSEYNREWRAKNDEYDRARKRQWYLENRQRLNEKSKARLREVRQQAGPKYRPDATKSYVIAEGRVYFNSKLGFSEEEILMVALKMREAARDAAKRIVSESSAGRSPAPSRAKQKADLRSA